MPRSRSTRTPSVVIGNVMLPSQWPAGLGAVSAASASPGRVTPNRRARHLEVSHGVHFMASFRTHALWKVTLKLEIAGR